MNFNHVICRLRDQKLVALSKGYVTKTWSIVIKLHRKVFIKRIDHFTTMKTGRSYYMISLSFWVLLLEDESDCCFDFLVFFVFSSEKNIPPRLASCERNPWAIKDSHQSMRIVPFRVMDSISWASMCTDVCIMWSRVCTRENLACVLSIMGYPSPNAHQWLVEQLRRSATCFGLLVPGSS